MYRSSHARDEGSVRSSGARIFAEIQAATVLLRRMQKRASQERIVNCSLLVFLAKMPFTKIFCYFGHFSYPIEEYANPWSSTQTSTSKNTPNSNEMNLCKSKRTTENAPNFYSIIQLHVLCLFQKARKHLLSLGSSCPPLASSEPNRPA